MTRALRTYARLYVQDLDVTLAALAPSVRQPVPVRFEHPTAGLRLAALGGLLRQAVRRAVDPGRDLAGLAAWPIAALLLSPCLFRWEPRAARSSGAGPGPLDRSTMPVLSG